MNSNKIRATNKSKNLDFSLNLSIYKKLNIMKKFTICLITLVLVLASYNSMANRSIFTFSETDTIIYSTDNTIDSLALVDLYNATNGPNWTNNDNWLTGPLNTWYGISCDQNQVTFIYLPENNLCGEIPESIGNLSNLSYLRLNTNQLSGNIPVSIGNLSEITAIIFYFNQLSGCIPENIGNLSNLTYLNLSSNELNGTIPESIGNLLSLESLILDNNQLIGNIPESFGNLNGLNNLCIKSNNLSGSIPESMCFLPQLHNLYLDNNQLESPIPEEFYSELTSLNILTLQGNNFGMEDCNIIYYFISNGGLNLFEHSPQNNGFVFLDDCITTGTITGIVVDSVSLEPLNNVIISIEGSIATTSSSEDGTYTIPYLNNGIYDITATTEFYFQKTQFNIEVLEGETTIVDFALSSIPPVLLSTIPDTGGIILEWETNYDITETGHFNFIGGDPTGSIWAIYISQATWDDIDMEAEDEIAIFDGDLMVGTFTLTQVCTPANMSDNELYAFSLLWNSPGYTPGNPVSFKAWDESAGVETSFFEYSFIGGYIGNVFPNGEPYSMLEINFLSYLPTYNIYYYEDSTLIASGILGNTYKDTLAVYGPEYCYFVTMNMENGSESQASNISCAFVLPFTGQIYGTINQINSNPITDAIITIDDTCLAATSGPLGTYFIDSLKTGYHNICVSAEGYETKCQDVLINKNLTSTLYFSLTATQTLTVEQGFQFISSRVIPVDPDLEIVAQEIINEDLIYIRNSQGYMLRKIGSVWVNGIGDWITSEGYFIKASASGQFTIEGSTLANTTPIEISQGFQFVSYLPFSEIDALDAFNSIISDNLIYIRNSEGLMLSKIGPNWVNGIGDCIPGEGYLTKILSDDTLIYPFNCGDQFTDFRDGRVYKTVEIGDQCWMAENLNSGIMITSSQQKDNGIIDKYCYDNSLNKCNIYGGLYQWNEMMQYTTVEGCRGICPEGWHLPSNDEWTILVDFLGGEEIAGGKMKKFGTSHWLSPNVGATNESGFTALAGGNVSVIYGAPHFSQLSISSQKWTSTYTNNNSARFWRILNSNTNIYSSSIQKTQGLSVRCVKDDIQTVNSSFYKQANKEEGFKSNLFNKRNSSNSPRHFDFKGGNPADAVYTLYLEGLEIGDEVAAFDREIMIGATKIKSKKTFENELPVFSSILTGQGYKSENPLNLKVWDSKINQEVEFNFEYKNPYGDAFMETYFPVNDGQYSILNITKNTSGLNDISINISIYPNPSKGIVTIGNLMNMTVLDLKITDITGKTVFQSKIENRQSSLEIDLSEIKKGVYLFSICNKDFKKIKKIVIQ